MSPTIDYIKTVINGILFRIDNLSKKIDKKISYNLEVSKADWNQNDETAADYVKNRTHWINPEEKHPTRELITKSLVVDEGYSTAHVAAPNGEFSLKDYEKFIVEYDGVEYAVNRVTMNNGFGVGNLSLIANSKTHPECYMSNVTYEDTGEPFALVDSQYYTPKCHYFANSSGEHAFTIYVVEQVIHPISEEYLPDQFRTIKKGSGNNSIIYNDVLNNKASGEYSHAEGYSARAYGSDSHAEGYNTTASGYHSHAEGTSTIATGSHSHAEGHTTTASGNQSHAEGAATKASGEYSHAEGHDTEASGINSHAEGLFTTASGNQSHAEGAATKASGEDSHAEGYNTTASGNQSHAEGYYTEASGNYSHAEGSDTKAIGKSQHVQGEFNIFDNGNISSRGKYAHIVGNGSNASARSNAHTLDWNGVPWFQGRPQFGGTAQDKGSQTVMANGDSEIILTSTGGKKFSVTVDDSGALTATEVT